MAALWSDVPTAEVVGGAAWLLLWPGGRERLEGRPCAAAMEGMVGGGSAACRLRVEGSGRRWLGGAASLAASSLGRGRGLVPASSPPVAAPDLVLPVALGAPGRRFGSGAFSLRLASVQWCTELGRRGDGPGRWGSAWLAGGPATRVLAGAYGRVGGVGMAGDVL